MEIYKLKDMKMGWFIGDFEPSVHKTDLFEAGVKQHHKGERIPFHYHKESVEINVVRKGKMEINGQLVQEGDIFILNKYEVVEPYCVEDCDIFIIKIPSRPSDKILVNG